MVNFEDELDVGLGIDHTTKVGSENTMLSMNGSL